MPSKQESKSEQKPYRPNVGIIVFNQQGEVLAGERTNVLGAWQFPQGGIDEGEEPKAAALRELYEEVGIANPKLVKESEEWLYYDFPDSLKLSKGMRAYKGQMQKWFLVFWNHSATECNLEVDQREFTEVKFMELSECVNSVVEFKRDVYRQLYTIFSPAIADYLQNPH